ncbi:membrane protein [Thioclava dalianensis]|uniref:Membrane protein n=1 Tax=Thioclava dalianensis TaxID=1185766 RepID=A0A074TRQ4_9RHOB|nr:DMT family transporter [Thioclava dalianensis]KEP71643.1 membrane protein [Thioclava dalianensis]SFN42253.1 Permease of the drug/metabolite transporter (DMT) superfamily [Thioclava dalianensis]
MDLNRENFHGSLLMIAAMAGFALEDMFVKALGERLAVGEVLVLLGVGGALIFGAFAKARGETLISRDLLSGSVLVRNTGEILGTTCFVAAVIFTPLAQASAILQATPLAVTLGAALFFGERVRWRRWSAIGIGFVGVLIVIRPGTEGFSVLSLLPVVSVIALAARDLATRRVPKAITSLQLATYGFGVVVPAGIVIQLVAGDPVLMPTARDWAYIAGALIAGPIGYYALIAAMRIGEVAVITPFRYVRLVFAVLIGWIVFAEPPDEFTLLGGAVIVGSGLYTLWRQAILRRRKARGRA